MCLENINDIVNILENLGFVINWEIFMMVFEKKIFFGFIISLEMMIIKILEKKMNKLKFKI